MQEQVSIDHWACDRNSCRMSIPQFMGAPLDYRLGSQMALENLDKPQWNWCNLNLHQTSHLEAVLFHCQKLNRAKKLSLLWLTLEEKQACLLRREWKETAEPLNVFSSFLRITGFYAISFESKFTLKTFELLFLVQVYY